ncbi:unnamed protein product [Adineta ricciae]|uniref:Small VCP/p97-interacting protein n=1 Tax=Adineta ricciae TaxID=249248 RepID=A0A814M224_ADIRI|nr:unnamed protein product [Adineta ricciae]CAF1124540.1 unnamed protein product [Adineta ricciae]
MGSLLDCFRGSNAQQNHRPQNIPTPDLDSRRQAAAEAANRRLEQMESRGVNTDEFQRLKQRQAEQERLQQQHDKLSKQGATDGLRWQIN